MGLLLGLSELSLLKAHQVREGIGKASHERIRGGGAGADRVRSGGFGNGIVEVTNQIKVGIDSAESRGK